MQHGRFFVWIICLSNIILCSQVFMLSNGQVTEVSAGAVGATVAPTSSISKASMYLPIARGVSSQATPSPTTQPTATPAPIELQFTLNDKGIASLAFAKQNMLLNVSWMGEVQISPDFTKQDGTTYTGDRTPNTSMLDHSAQTLMQTFDWGSLECVYKQNRNDLNIKCEVKNRTADQMTDFIITLLHVNYPEAPVGTITEGGMFGTGGFSSLAVFPFVVDPNKAAPVVFSRWQNQRALDFFTDGTTSNVGPSVPFHAYADYNFPFSVVSYAPVTAGESRTFNATLRFARVTASQVETYTTSGDVLAQYRTAHPYRLNWADRRAIGLDILADNGSLGVRKPKNPRAWFNNSDNVDVTTPDGLLAFRKSVLERARNSVNVLKNTMNAQGVIFWDLEGAQYPAAVYVGDPRVVPTWAPEWEFDDGSGVKTLDAYLQVFKNAGLRIGITLRGQKLVYNGGVPVGQTTYASAQEALVDLTAKARYAVDRWGTTLFYVDSTVTETSCLDPTIFEQLHVTFPNVLFIPENECSRYFQVSAPLNSTQHTLRTPPGVTATWPEAFSGLMLQGAISPNAEAALVEHVRSGGFLIADSWYAGAGSGAELVRRIYQQAGR